MRMSEAAEKCPACKTGHLKVVDEQLDQSGLTHLPTKAHVCVNGSTVGGADLGCGYKRWDPAVNTPWKSNAV